jgi:hypothetical protein
LLKRQIGSISRATTYDEPHQGAPWEDERLRVGCRLVGRLCV